ncbi:hypothetical protein HDE_11278 [Halotydeus destructor]|nr:hypothetical protein HDE_11278 [Halotydeus destructor]
MAIVLRTVLLVTVLSAISYVQVNGALFNLFGLTVTKNKIKTPDNNGGEKEKIIVVNAPRSGQSSSGRGERCFWPSQNYGQEPFYSQDAIWNEQYAAASSSK